MPAFSKISALAKRVMGSMPAPESLNAHIYDDDQSEGDETVQMVDRLRDEARLIHGPIEREALDAIHIYMGNQWEVQKVGGDALDSQRGTVALQTVVSGDNGNDDMIRPVINRTQNAELSNVEARTSRPPQIRYEPEESGEDGEFWLTKRGAEVLMKLRADAEAKLEQALIAQGEAQAAAVLGEADPMASAPVPIDEEAERANLDTMFPDVLPTYDAQVGPTAPLSESEAGAVMGLIEQGLMKKSDLQKIDDDATADAIQRIAGLMNREADFDRKYLNAALRSTNAGFNFVRFTYLTRGSKKHRISLESMPIKAVWIDPYHDCVADADYVGEDRMVSLERAKVMYPELGNDLLELAASNSGSDTADVGIDNSRYHRDMLQITTCWLRHHTVPVSVERALREGWVEETPVTVVEVGEDGQESEETIMDEDTGKPKVRYVLTDEGAEHVGKGAKAGEDVEPQHERDHGTNWPDAEGIRQVVTIHGINQPVQDVRCPYLDIPYLLFINVPRVDGSPLGQGDAQRLEDIQREINRVAAIIINNQRHAQFPMMFIPQTIKDILDSTGMGLFYEPGAVQGLPDEMLYALLQAAGNLKALIMEPPQLNAASMQLLELLLTEHDNLSGNVGVRQGRNPPGVTAGVAIAQLQEHAMGTLALKARLDEHVLTYYGKLLQHAIVTWFPETEWMRVLSKYELPVLRRIIERASTLDCNVQVSVAAGRGITKQLDRAQTMEMYDKGLASVEDTLADLEVEDAQGKAQKILQERGMVQPTGGNAAPSADQVAPGPQR